MAPVIFSPFEPRRTLSKECIIFSHAASPDAYFPPCGVKFTADRDLSGITSGHIPATNGRAHTKRRILNGLCPCQGLCGRHGTSAKIRRCSILIAITCLSVVALPALLAVAQLPDYGKLFSSGGAEAVGSAEKASSGAPAVGAPQQLLPTPEFRASAGLSAVVISGSQTLERDILSGTVFLLDDAFPKGENIDVGNVKGTVEKVSLRSFQLSQHLGMLHTIPFGEIQHLTKFSRDWVMMKLPLRLTYDTDIRREGVRFAHREVTVRARGLPNDRELDRDEQKMVGAARNALDAVEAERPKKPVPGGQWMTAEQGRRDAGASDG